MAAGRKSLAPSKFINNGLVKSFGHVIHLGLEELQYHKERKRIEQAVYAECRDWWFRLNIQKSEPISHSNLNVMSILFIIFVYM